MPDVIIAGAAGPVTDAAANFLTPALDGQISAAEALVLFQGQLEADLASASR